MLIELAKDGFKCIPQCLVDVYYDADKIGYYLADIIVDEKSIIEIKAAEGLSDAHETPLTNYLKATKIEVGLLLNFGKKPGFKRRVFSTEFKS